MSTKKRPLEVDEYVGDSTADDECQPRDEPPWLDDDMETLRECFCMGAAYHLLIVCENRRIRSLEKMWSFSELFKYARRLTIRNSSHLRTVPSWIKKLSLGCLSLVNCPLIETLPDEFDESHDAIIALDIANCERFRGFPEHSHFSDFPGRGIAFRRVINLTITNCPELSFSRLSFSIEEREIERVTLKDFAKVQSLRLSPPANSLSLENFARLRELVFDNVALPSMGLTIECCPLLRQLPDCRQLSFLKLTRESSFDLAEVLRDMRQLQKLYINDHSNLVSLPDCLCDLEKLEDLRIDNCPRFERFPDGFHAMRLINHLFIRNTSRLSSLPRMPIFINQLTLIGLDGIRSLHGVVGKEHQNFAGLVVSHCTLFEQVPQDPLLQVYMTIRHCPSFRLTDFGRHQMCIFSLAYCNSFRWAPSNACETGEGCVVTFPRQFVRVDPLAELLRIHASGETFLSIVPRDVIVYLQPFLGGTFIERPPEDDPKNLETSASSTENKF